MEEALKEKLKAEGLELAEESVKDLVENALVTIRAIVKVTENKYDDMALPLIDLAEKAIMDAVDKIDGEVG
ncbi:MAG: hypothetical protein ACO2ZP_07340 [Bacteriovoracaceae bacterium]